MNLRRRKSPGDIARIAALSADQAPMDDLELLRTELIRVPFAELMDRTSDGHDDFVGICGPGEGLRLGVVFVKETVDGGCFLYPAAKSAMNFFSASGAWLRCHADCSGVR